MVANKVDGGKIVRSNGKSDKPTSFDSNYHAYAMANYEPWFAVGHRTASSVQTIFFLRDSGAPYE